MKSTTQLKQQRSFPRGKGFLFILMTALAVVMHTNLPAQAPAEYTRPSWWFGVAGAGNVNFFGGSTQRLTNELVSQVAFHDGIGLGLFVAPVIEYHNPDSRWGLGLQAGYDSRKGKYEQEFSPCNCPRDLKTKLSYASIEPYLRFAPFKQGLFVFAGPRVAINLQKSFLYEQGINPDYPEQLPIDDITGDLSEVKPVLFSGQVGLGYDIFLNSTAHKTQWMLTPFASFHPYFGQSPRNIETLTMTTIRAGFALKLGRGRLIKVEPVKREVIVPKPVVENKHEVDFTVYSPGNIPVKRKVREYFPIRNYVFFDEGSTSIPPRYVLLRQGEVAHFKESNVYLTTPANFSGRSERQMIVYYNILNILGDRMGKSPNSTIRLVGSSKQGEADGLAMATSIKTYLVDVFGIAGSRIAVEGRLRPELPSGKQGGTLERELLNQGDRRVTIESNSPELMMEFQSGPSAPLKAVEVTEEQDAPIDSYVSFYNKGAHLAFEEWSLQFTDKAGQVQTFGPYKQDRVSIPGKSILGARPEGDFDVVMIGTEKNGDVVRKESKIHMVLWTPPSDLEAMRFSVIYEFDESKALPVYERYINEIVIPKIPQGARVMIHGYTDVIGNETYNEELSMARANDVKGILEAGLSRLGRTDVKLEVFGFGEDLDRAQFQNRYPEERFYNRSVIIDILPLK